MVFRITTWNVNGIRNPFSYEPWRARKTFAAMFDVLEADIVVMQETKIQRKDLQDDMVLVPGWDCYFSLPKYKKGYSGVAVYTRQSVCAPIRAEEGVTGILSPPNSSTSYLDLPAGQQIGGYPTLGQLSRSSVDPATLDSEGRCLLVEFPAFVLIGVYSPANRDETRDEFRLGFLNALDSRVRNLVAEGKRVILTGDLNISREEMDTANAEEQMRKHGLAGTEFVATPARRLFNQLLVGGKVFGDRDEGREEPIMWDICRGFHDERRGMFTCWEQRINARPGNFGSRIDYVLCSYDMKDWFCESNIQEGLLGSDHCPVYAVIKDKVQIDGAEVHVLDLLSPPGTFKEGLRLNPYSTKDIPALSAKLIPEFDRRRNIRDMFTRKPSLSSAQSLDFNNGDAMSVSTEALDDNDATQATESQASDSPLKSGCASTLVTKTQPGAVKRPAGEPSTNKGKFKRSKSGSSSAMAAPSSKGQQSLKGFFRPQIAVTKNSETLSLEDRVKPSDSLSDSGATPSVPASPLRCPPMSTSSKSSPTGKEASTVPTVYAEEGPTDLYIKDHEAEVHDPIVAKESWSKLFTKRSPPKCEGHNEHCITLTTKKLGINCGRAFWICPRPVGPTGTMEKGTQWRCNTFIWSSDWNAGGGS